jgi:hypothetical protein
MISSRESNRTGETPVPKRRHLPARGALWSAVTCHRFCRFGDLSPKQGRDQRPVVCNRMLRSRLTATSRLPKARTSSRTPKPAASFDSTPSICGFVPSAAIDSLIRIHHGRAGQLRSALTNAPLQRGVGEGGGVETVLTVSMDLGKPFKRFSLSPNLFTALKRGVNEMGREVPG